LDTDFASFVAKNCFEYLYLCVDSGDAYRIDVLNAPHINRMKLGKDWDFFCESQGFKAGDRIRFKFQRDASGASRRCHVFKLN
jgi:hypothetical protein